MTLNILVIQHQDNAGAALLGARLHAANVNVVTAHPQAGHPLPDTLDGFDGVVVLGGYSGPLEDTRAPWLPQTRKLMREALNFEIPLLGICLGAQLLSVVAGGEVTESPTPEVGIHEIFLTAAASTDPLLGILQEPLRAMQWHFLEVSRLPEGSTTLATSPRCANQAFRVGPLAWGLQFHLEAGINNALEWTDGNEKDLARAGATAEQVISQMRAEEPALHQLWTKAADQWIAIVAENRTEQAA